MKKFFAALLAFMMCLTIASCGREENNNSVEEKPNEVKEVEEYIEDIGKVDFESEKDIVNAETGYSKLSDADKLKVENANVLKEAREKLNKLYVSAAEKAISEIGVITSSSATAVINARKAYDLVPEKSKKDVKNYQNLIQAENDYRESYIIPVEESIDRIGQVTLSSQENIELARDAYDALDEDAKTMVRNYVFLTEAEFQYENYNVFAVIGIIDEIGTVNYASKNAIKAAREAFDALSYDEQTRVTNSDVLVSAESAYEDLKNNIDSQDIFTRINIEYSNGVTWYESTAMPEYIDNESYVLPYIGSNGSSVWLRLVFDYVGYKSIGFTKVTVVADDVFYQKSFNSSEMSGNQVGGTVWEYIDINPDDTDIEMLWKIVYSESAYIRFEGDVSYETLAFGEDDKAAISDVLLYYEILSGTDL